MKHIWSSDGKMVYLAQRILFMDFLSNFALMWVKKVRRTYFMLCYNIFLLFAKYLEQYHSPDLVITIDALLLFSAGKNISVGHDLQNGNN